MAEGLLFWSLKKLQLYYTLIITWVRTTVLVQEHIACNVYNKKQNYKK